MRRRRLTAEYLLVFFGLVGGYLAVRPPGGPIPPLILAAGAALVYLRRQPGFDRRDLLRPGAVRPALPGILLLWAAVSLVMVAGVAVFAPDRLFDMPRQRTALWAAIVVLYPLLSVYPQELLFRAFLLHRYADPAGARRVAPAARAPAGGGAGGRGGQRRLEQGATFEAAAGSGVCRVVAHRSTVPAGDEHRATRT